MIIPENDVVPGATGGLVASSTVNRVRPYQSRVSDVAESETWVDLDLGAAVPFDAVRLYPSSIVARAGEGFPVRFKIEYRSAPDDSWSTVVDWSDQDFPHPHDQIVEFQAPNAFGRFVRLTATKLRALERYVLRANELVIEQGEFVLSLNKIEVSSEGSDVALGARVAVDALLGNSADAAQLTRPPRPNGEEQVTDNPGAATSPDSWSPVPDRAVAPVGGVEVRGLFAAALELNTEYLLGSFTVNDMLVHFRRRAGLPAPEPDHPLHFIWDENLQGSSAGRFLMGAGNTLRWRDDPELRRRADEIVDGIEAARTPNGFIMAYPEDTYFQSERGAYVRAWITHGLLEMAKLGNPKALGLVRGFYDWYNAFEGLPLVLRRCGYGPQGTVANTRVYFSPVGTPEDLQTVQRYLQEDYWMEDLAARRPEALGEYPYDRQHSYLITCVEPYADLYRATGDRRYLDAVLGAHELFHDNWQSPGGSFTIMEGKEIQPRSNPLFESLGETCGSAFWILLNQRLHQLDPDEEHYVAEIEKSIYNVLLANQSGVDGIRYHTVLSGHKEPPICDNTCCEGQATRLLGSLPEFIYSLSPDGIWINLFEPSTIRWQLGGADVSLTMDTRFPDDPAVSVEFGAAEAVRMTVRVRVPSWSTAPMEVRVNDEAAAIGMPGTFVPLEREWRPGDRITFVLPAAVRVTRYVGMDEAPGRPRYSVEYGPIQLAALWDAERVMPIPGDGVEGLPQHFERAEGPLAFTLDNSSLYQKATRWIPYYAVQDETFTCVPMIAAGH